MATEFNKLNPLLIFDFNDFNAVVLGGLDISAVILNQNPLLYYRFQETTGITVEDSSGNNNDGTSTFTGITRAQPPSTDDDTDTSYLFDGSNGFITTPTSSPSLSQAFTALTVECWIRVPSLPSYEQTIVGKGDGPGDDHFQLSLAPDGRVKFWFSDNISNKIAFSKSVILPGTWSHVMAVWDGSSNTIYLNGASGVSVSNVAAPVTSAKDIQVSAYNSADRFNGFIDELAIYDQALLLSDAQDRFDLEISGNSVPVITSATANGVGSGTLNIFQGDTVTFVINATDDDSDTLQYSFSQDGYISSVGPQLGNSTTIQYTDTGIFNPIAFVTDGNSNRAAPFPTINVAPVVDLISFNDSFSTNFRSSKTLTVLDNDSFPAGGAGSIQSFTQPPGGTVTLQGSGETATLLYDPDTDFSGQDTFTYTITDGGFGTSTASVTVDVAEKQPPTANALNVKVAPDSTDNIVVPQSNDQSDPPGEVLTLISVETPTPQGGTVTLDSANNRALYTPATGYLGADSFSYVIEDEAGLTAVGIVNISVNTIAYEALLDVTSTPYETPVTLDVLANDTTPFPDPVTIQSVTQPPAGEGTVTITGGGTTVTYDPTGTGFSGTTSFTYTSTDLTRSDTANVSVTVAERSPRAIADRLSTPVNTPVSLDVMANDSDPEGLPFDLVAFTQPPVGEGTVTREDNGTPGDQSDDTLLYTPPLNFEGVTSFTYTIEDAVGQQSTATCQVAVGFILNISVSQSQGPATVTFSFEANPTAATGFDKSYSYFWDFRDGYTSTQRNPSHIFAGIGVFDVQCTVTDSYGVSKTETVTVEVIANQSPVANDISTDLAEGQVLNFDPRSNDSDADGGQIFISDADATSTLGGTVSINNAGTPASVFDDYLTYTHPALPTPFTDTFTYEISDEFGLTDTATVTVNVLENLAPSLSPVFVTTIFEQDILIDPLANASDPEDDELFISSVTSPGSGSVQIVQPAQKVLSYSPANGFLGTVTFDVTIRDTFFNTVTDQVTIAVFGQFYPARVVQDNPIGFWNFNEPDAQGNTAYDVMPLTNHGRYINLVTRDGVLGPLAKDLENCANVDQGYVRIGTVPYTLEDTFSLELWVYNTSAGSSAVISPFFTVSNNGTTYQFTLDTNSDSATLTFSGLEVNEWHYFGITYDGQFLRGYVDLQLVTSAPLVGDVQLPRVINPGLGMAGKIAALALYDTTLALSDFEAHYAEAVGDIVSYDVSGPDFVPAGSEFDVTARARDITGKRVLTNSTEDVTFSASDPAIEFDADGDGNFNEP